MSLSFFVIENPYSAMGDSRTFDALCSLYFAVNTDKIYSSVVERQTEYIVRDIVNALVRTNFNYSEETDAVAVGQDAFSDFDLVKDGDDMRPFLLLRFRGRVKFQYNNCI
jgi:hypothetical protein